jgi:multimeric flavodoxin WrbA
VVQAGCQNVYRKLIAADVVVLSAPLFFWNLPVQVESVIDRSRGQWARKVGIKKPLLPTPAGFQRRGRRRQGLFRHV